MNSTKQNEMKPETTRKTTETEQEVLGFLNALRESGATNMFGAGPYIEAEFPSLGRSESTRMLKLWMANFSADGDYATVSASA